MVNQNGYEIHITHFRVPEERPGEMFKMSDIRRHGWTPLSQGGATFAFVYPENTFPDSLHLTMGVAHCSGRDNFCKKTGRDIAIGRAMKRLNGGTA